MSQKLKTYGLIALIFAVASLFLLHPKSSALIQALAAIPMFSSLIAALIQILKDQAAHDRALFLQQSQNSFLLASGSHMAITAFDKHVEFSDKYIKESQKTLQTLFRDGPSENVLPHAWALYELRQDYAIWLTEQIDTDLDLFESALREIGSKAYYVEAVGSQESSQQQRLIAIDKLYNVFAKVMGFEEWEEQKLPKELTLMSLTHKVRAILGIEDLTKMRASIIANAISSLQHNS